jgi:hypothetical protein
VKISEATSYPHPLLAPWSDDILPASFSSEIIFRESVETNQVSVHCETLMEHPGITRLINEGVAAFGCFIKCRETGFRRLQQLGFPIGLHDFAPGALLGRVRLRPIVWALKKIEGYAPDGVHPEFGESVDVEVGGILALGYEKIIDVSRAPVPSIESIFEIKASSDIADGEFGVDTSGERVNIRVSETTFGLILELRRVSEESRAVVMNSLYVPVIMEMLSQLADGPEEFQKYRWFHPFMARCEAMGIDLGKTSLLSDAQKMLNKPFSELAKLIGEAQESCGNE